MITRVHHLLDDTVMAFRKMNGKSIVAFSGKYDDVIDRIKREATDETEFYVEGMLYKISPGMFYDRSMYDFFKSKEKKKCGKESE